MRTLLFSALLWAGVVAVSAVDVGAAFLPPSHSLERDSASEHVLARTATILPVLPACYVGTGRTAPDRDEARIGAPSSQPADTTFPVRASDQLERAGRLSAPSTAPPFRLA